VNEKVSAQPTPISGADAAHIKAGVHKVVLVPPAERLRLKEEAVEKKHAKLHVVPVPDTSLYEIRYEGPGKTPLPLQGRYTARVYAERAIQDYING